MKLTIRAIDADQADLIQRHLDLCKARDTRGQRIEIEAACDAVRLEKGLVIDPWYCSLDFGGAEVHYLPDDGVAITQLSHKANAFTQLCGGVSNINLRTVPGGNAVGLELKGTAPETRTSTNMEKVTIQGFNTGLQMSDYAYLTWFDGLIIDGCATQVRWLPGVDAGENVNIVKGIISNGGLALDMSGQSSCLNLAHVSIDYNQKVAKVTGSGARVMMNQCHIEMPGGSCLPGQIVVDGNSSMFMMRDGEFLISDRYQGGNLPGPYGFSHMIEVLGVNCSAEFIGTRLHNHRNVADTWAIGPGRIVVEGGPTYGDSLMPRRSHHSQCAMALLSGSVWQEQANNTLQVVAANNRVTGTRGQVGAGFVQVMCVAIPVIHLRGRRITVAPKLSSDMGTNFRFSEWWSDVPVRTPGAQMAKFNAWTGSTPWVNGVATPTVVTTPPDLRVPYWASYLLLEVDLSGGAAGKRVTVEDVEIGAW